MKVRVSSNVPAHLPNIIELGYKYIFYFTRGWGFSMLSRLAWNSWFSCLCHINVGSSGMCHHAWLQIASLHKTKLPKEVPFDFVSLQLKITLPFTLAAIKSLKKTLPDFEH